MTLTEAFLTEHNHLFTDSSCEFTVVRSSSISGSKEYERYHRALIELFVHDSKFNASIHTFIDAYLSRQGRLFENSVEHRQRCTALSCQFILAELAVVACIIDRGYSISVYPGSIDLFHEISAGEHPDIPSSLMRLINVGISFRRRGNGARTGTSVTETTEEN